MTSSLQSSLGSIATSPLAPLNQQAPLEVINWLINQRNLILATFINDPQQFIAAINNQSQLIPRNQEICAFSDLVPHQHPRWYKMQLLGPAGAIGIPFLVQFGSEFFVLKKTELKRTEATFDVQAPRGVFIESSALQCNFYRPGLSYIGLDEFTNEIMIGFFLNWKLKEQGYTKNGYRPIVGHLGAFICQFGSDQFAYLLIEYCDLGSLDKFPRSSAASSYKEVVEYPQGHQLIQIEIFKRQWSIEILKQVVLAFLTLQNLTHFISGDAKVANIFLTSRPLQLNYQGLVINSPFTCKIADYGKSSITINLAQRGMYRIYNKAKTPIIDILSPYRQLRQFTFSVQTAADGSQYYVLPQFLEVDILVQIRHLGIPAYISIDIYTFMLSWLLMPEFYYSLMTSSYWRAKIWNLLWYPDDLETIDQRLYQGITNGLEPSFRRVIPLLKGLKLKCQALSLLFQSLIS